MPILIQNKSVCRCDSEGRIQEQLLYRNVQRFRGGLVLKAHRLVYHATLGLRVIKKKKKQPQKMSLAWGTFRVFGGSIPGTDPSDQKDSCGFDFGII